MNYVVLHWLAGWVTFDVVGAVELMVRRRCLVFLRLLRVLRLETLVVHVF